MDDNRKFDMRGTYLIDDANGKLFAVLEYYSPIPGTNESILYFFYRDENGRRIYDSLRYEFDKEFEKFKSDRYFFMHKSSINHVYHFSPIENTQSILEHGILSREEAGIRNVGIEITDPNRFDGELNKISASISFPNYKMRYSLEQKGKNLVIYDIDPRILLCKLDTQFYYTNAANSVFRNLDKSRFTTNEALKGMFTDYKREQELDRSFPTDPQAEVLIDTEIPLKFINGVITKEEDYDIEFLCKERGISYSVDKALYDKREKIKEYYKDGE